MSSRARSFLLGSLVGVFLAASMFSVGLALGFNLDMLGESLVADRGVVPPLTEITTPPEPVETTPLSPEEKEVLFVPFWEAWDIVQENYVDQPLDNVELMRGAIRGMVDSIGDQHTSYMDPTEFRQASAPLEGYEGIGAWVDTDAEYLTIIAPIPGSPAEEVGLLPGDEVIAVDGEDMTGIDGNLVVQRVLGPAGTNVHLTVRREGTSELLEFDIVRARIIIPSVEGEMLDGDIAYLRIFTFGDETTRDLRDTLDLLLAEEPVGLILDLRNNGGGFLDTAIEVSSEFIAEGVIVTERFGDGREQIFEARKGGQATDVPLVVLINGGSASASEIVAGAIQDHDRGTLIGETSFGKGSVQQWIPLTNEEGAVRVTTARWYTPDDRLIHELGLVPDIEIELTMEDFEAQEDPQLEAAIDVLRGDAVEPIIVD